MRTTIARINLVLRTNKRLSDGTFPIMLRVNWKGMKQRDNLNYWLTRCNDEIIKRNVEGDDIPLIEVDKCNYYSYRHTFIMGEVQKPNCNFIALAQMVGKSVNTLYQYISELTHDKDLI